MQRHLIVTADDFGLHETVNEAVERTNRGGILTAASLIVSGPAAADAVRRARRLPTLRVGLHLVLADGWPSLPRQQIPCIAEADGRMGEDMLRRCVRYFASASARKQLEAEMRAQFVAFSRTGLALDHVSAHKHFHLHPTVLDILIGIAREFGARAMRVPNEPLWFAARNRRWLAAGGGTLLTPWFMLMRHRLRAAGIFHNDCVFGIAPSDSTDEAQLLAIFARLPLGVTEIYLHPAAALRAYRRTDEQTGLLSPRVREALAALNVQRGGYSDILMNIGRSLA
jgi:hopanoid biosynthesis associated protein HpnK